MRPEVDAQLLFPPTLLAVDTTGAGLLGPPPADAGAALPGMDWLCDMCQATNFGRWATL